MSEDKVLLFVMLGGAQIASEGKIDEPFDSYGNFYTASHIKNGEAFVINLRNVISIIAVERSKVLTGPVKVVMPPEGGFN